MLTVDELGKIHKELNREPNKEELAVFEAMWSEHCSYKSSKRWFHLFNTKASYLELGIGEGAGLIDIGDELLIGLGLESHNHPSAIDPFNGAATGIGGIIRDILSQGCRPIALLDSLRFGNLSSNHSQHLLENVVRGIAFYGNCCGIPTIGGEVEFAEHFEYNCLVNAMCVGIVKRKHVVRSIASTPGDFFIIYGARTGRDGIHGVSFASKDLSEKSHQDRPAVQIGDPLIEKILIDVTLELTEKGLLSGLQDLGGGGLACAISEMCFRGKTGAVIRLEDVPLRESDMKPWEILVSESQERMMAVVSPKNLDAVLEILEKNDIVFAVLGEVTDNSHFIAYYKGNKVLDLPVALIVDGFPIPKRTEREPDYIAKVNTAIKLPIGTDMKKEILTLLSSPNICDKSWIYQQYDQHVQTRTIISAGQDSAILRLENNKYLAITIDANSFSVYLNPYHGTANSAAEAMRNLVASGAKPLAIVDCLNFGNPEQPDSYWQFVQAVKGLAQFSHDFNLPIVGGNVSFYNESVKDDKRERILPTPTIGMVGVIENLGSILPNNFQENSSHILLIGKTEKNLGGSEYCRYNHRLLEGKIAEYNKEREAKSRQAIEQLNDKQLIASCHDLSHGGFITALVEMLIPKRIGATISLDKMPSVTNIQTEELLFAETPARYLVEVKPTHIQEVKELLDKIGVPYGFIGKTIKESLLKIEGVTTISINEILEAWRGTLPLYMEV
ncbi:MAG: phosphoribosylformylglycinamidine synthase subunit PurL [Candidatus Heimdallarchaeaceae archaeon]